MAKKVLFVGEHPEGNSGCSHMMKAVLNSVDRGRYEIACFSENILFNADAFRSYSFPLISPPDPNDQFGTQALKELVSHSHFDALVFVGIDIWHQLKIWKDLKRLKEQRRFKWAAIFPYDLHEVRKDWVRWIRDIDSPCVYSKYGYDLLKPHVSHISYFRPPLFRSELYTVATEEQRKEAKWKHLKGKDQGKFIFGFVGNNQVRKDPQRLIRAFFEVKKSLPDSVLYLHMNVNQGVFNIPQYLEDLDGQQGDVICKGQSTEYTEEMMVEVYRLMDCLVNCSLQEGLSLTLLNAMLTGTPVVAAHNTAQMELVDREVGFPVPCTELAHVPVVTTQGVSYVDSRACSFDDLVNSMYIAATETQETRKRAERARKRAEEWVQNASDINILLDEVTAKRVVRLQKLKKVLFMQHSSAGDVLMTTQCFKGIKGKHKGYPLVYMTQPFFKDIVQGNPYVDEIIDWDEEEERKYEIVYNPHGHKILPGHWNTGDTLLHDMYSIFTGVKQDCLFIDQVKPDIELPEEYIVVHTTGGHIARMYRHMDVAVAKLKIPVVQVGGINDFPCKEATLDLRGKLTWRQTAYVMARAAAAVTIDSFPSHLAGALRIPQVVIFGTAPSRVTKPKTSAPLICIEPDKLNVCPIVGSCWGEFKCETPCINTISPLLVRRELKRLLDNQQKELKE